MSRIPIISLFVLVVSLMVLGGGQVHAAGCDVVVTTPAPIQDAIDAHPGGKVCLDDSGVFSQAVVFGPEDSGVTLMAKPGENPVMDGSGLPHPLDEDLNAITLQGGVSGVTIQGLEIRNYVGNFTDPEEDGSTLIDAVSAGPVVDITIRDSYLHHSARAISTGGNGGFVHTNWKVENNLITDQSDTGIRFRNVAQSKIKDNFFRDSATGIFVGARVNNLEGGAVLVGNVEVKGNHIFDGSDEGIRLRARVSGVTSGTARLTDVKVEDNNINNFDNGIIIEVRGAGATADQVDVEANLVTNSSGNGILVGTRESGATLVDQVNVEENVVTNSSENAVLLITGDGGTITNGQIKQNVLLGNTHSGINIIAEASGLISNNNVSKNSSNGNSVDGLVLSAYSYGILADNQVEKNVLNGNHSRGIWVIADDSGVLTGNTIKGNSLNNNSNGMIVSNDLPFSPDIGTVDGNTIEGNASIGSVLGHGFSTDTGSGVNIFNKNRADLNGQAGFTDAPVPTNVYEQNTCNFNVAAGSLPAGLCSP